MLLLAGPLGGVASASPCKRFGKDNPRHLSQRQARTAIRCLVNRKRVNHGLRRVGKSARLKKAAQKHTRHMQDHRCFAHECPGEPSVLSRLKKVRYIHGGLRKLALRREHRVRPKPPGHAEGDCPRLDAQPGAPPQHPEPGFPRDRDRLCPRDPATAGLGRGHGHDGLRNAEALAASRVARCERKRIYNREPDLRAWCSGCTRPFQGLGTGSSPVARSSVGAFVAHGGSKSAKRGVRFGPRRLA